MAQGFRVALAIQAHEVAWRRSILNRAQDMVYSRQNLRMSRLDRGGRISRLAHKRLDIAQWN